MWPRSSASDRSLCGAYLNMPRGVFWTPLDRWSVRQSQVTSPASFPSELFDWQLRIRISEVTSVPLCPTSKGKTIFRASIHPASHSTACCVFCGDFCFIRWSEEQNPFTLSAPNSLHSVIIRQKPTGKMKQWLSTMKIEWCTFRVQLVCALVTYVSLVWASAPLSPSGTHCTQTSVLNWWWMNIRYSGKMFCLICKCMQLMHEIVRRQQNVGCLRWESCHCRLTGDQLFRPSDVPRAHFVATSSAVMLSENSPKKF